MQSIDTPERGGWPARWARWDREHPWLAALVLVAFVAIVYAPSLYNGFIWDDDLYVQNNLLLRSLAGLHDIWFRITAFPQYYPLVQTSFWIEYHLWELTPAGYHVTNMALHAGGAVLLWRLLLRLAVPGAWLAAAVFAVHPVHVESVAWVTERKNVLSIVFALGSLLVYLRASPPEAPPGTRPAPAWRYALAWLLYVCALFSKTVTSSVPAVLLVILWWKRGRITARDVAWLTPFFAVGLALASVTVWMEQTVVGASGADWDLSIVDRVLIAGRAAWFYAGKLVWPHPLVFFYPRWEIDAGVAWQYLFPAAGALLIGVLWSMRNRIGRGPLAAVLIFVGVLTPALGFFDVFPFRYSFVADHFQYHASAALLTLVVAAACVAGARLGARAAIPAVAVALATIVALGAIARGQVRHYRDLPTLYRSVIASNPGSWAAHNNLGKFLQNDARYEEALAHFDAALQLAPQNARIRNNRGSALTSLDRLDEAAEELGRALTSEADSLDQTDSRVLLAVVRIRQQRFDEAVALLQMALQLRPQDAWTLYNLGVALAGGGDLEAGSTAVRASLAIDPESAERQRELGAMRRALGDAPGAVGAYAEAVRIEPAHVATRIDLALMLAQTGDLAGAERELREALAVEPAHADASNALGSVLGQRGDLAGAQAAFEQTLRAAPDHPLARENLRRLREAAAR